MRIHISWDMAHCVTALVVPNILQKHGAITFKGQVHEECQMWKSGGDIYIYMSVVWWKNGEQMEEVWMRPGVVMWFLKSVIM